jgi:two-component system OmpR family response regulator
VEDAVEATVLVVDDEAGVNDLIVDALHLSGFATLSARHGQEALRMVREHRPDLLILDLSMPRMDGLEVLERLRGAGDVVPVIILTARLERDDLRSGFDLGADDFVRKPFGIEELILRVRAVLRRARPDDAGPLLTVGRVTVDEDRHLVLVDGDEVPLSATEFRLLGTLMESAGRVLSREALLQRVWGLDRATDSTVVETYVSYLRRKLGDAVSIRTVRGVGYQLQVPDPA